MSPTARALGFSLVLCGCSSGQVPPQSGPLSFPNEPLMTMLTRAGSGRVQVRTAPVQPPTGGIQTVQLVIADATTGEPETGLSLKVVPWMPAMGHGTALIPTVTEGPPGTYVVGDVDLFMPGTWELRTSILGVNDNASASGGAASDYVAPSFEIP